MKKTFGWLFIIVGSINLLISFMMMANGVMGEGSQNPITKLFFAIGFVVLGAYMIGAFKEKSARVEINIDSSSKSKPTINDSSLSSDNLRPNSTDIPFEHQSDKPQELGSIEENKSIDIGEQMRIQLVQKLFEQYELQFNQTLDNSYVRNLAISVSKISKSYSDTSISMMNITNALQGNQNIIGVRKSLISISKNYSTNTMKNLNSIGLILGKQTIEIPHFTANQSNIPLEMIYQQGYELIGLAQQVGIEREVIEILSAE